MVPSYLSAPARGGGLTFHGAQLATSSKNSRMESCHRDAPAQSCPCPSELLPGSTSLVESSLMHWTAL